ncbi:MAG: glycosyltransferase [Pyrinomonadaceae bacterium]|nr:glycosyltransferase [Sphingobacteriaceae bacterium]
MLNVVHISTSRFGGAGRAAFRLHESMLADPTICSTFISSDNDINDENQYVINIPHPKHQLYERVANKLGLPILHFHKNLWLQARLKGSHEIYSMPKTDFVLENMDIIKDADIINLHWVSNFINYPVFFKAYKNKPIVWTLHDMNPFMGGFHYKNDLINNPSYSTLENSLLKIKKKSVRSVKNLNIVSPSTWLMNEAIESNVFSTSQKTTIIPYGLDLTLFKPMNKKEAKNKLSIDPTIPCLLIVAQDLTASRKGFDILIKAIKSLNGKNFQLLTIGNHKLNLKVDYKIKELGHVNNDELLSVAYSAADLFILPSREDNLPNVMLESFACGTPVLSFKVGGMLDWIRPGFNGLFCESIDSDGLKEGLEKFLNSYRQFDAKKIREFAQNNFTSDIQAQRYIDFYQSILDS